MRPCARCAASGGGHYEKGSGRREWEEGRAQGQRERRGRALQAGGRSPLLREGQGKRRRVRPRPCFVGVVEQAPEPRGRLQSAQSQRRGPSGRASCDATPCPGAPPERAQGPCASAGPAGRRSPPRLEQQLRRAAAGPRARGRLVSASVKKVLDGEAKSGSCLGGVGFPCPSACQLHLWTPLPCRLLLVFASLSALRHCSSSSSGGRTNMRESLASNQYNIKLISVFYSSELERRSAPSFIKSRKMKHMKEVRGANHKCACCAVSHRRRRWQGTPITPQHNYRLIAKEETRKSSLTKTIHAFTERGTRISYI